jgi:hypothetical protein
VPRRPATAAAFVPTRGHHELDRVGGVHVLPDVQEPDLADPVTLAVLDRASGAQILQRGGELLELDRRGRPHSQGAPGGVARTDAADDPAWR